MRFSLCDKSVGFKSVTRRVAKPAGRPEHLANVAGRFYCSTMNKTKELTVRELARLGGLARARKHSKRKLRAWGKLGGRPKKRPKD